MQDPMSNVSREMKRLKENQKEMLEIETTVTEMRNALDVFISRLDITKKRISELEETSIETFKMEKQRENNEKCGTEDPRTVDNCSVNTHNENIRKKRE